ncbi:MAG: DUF302 domain-containing protein [Bryobacterales bacterium]|nr:DUF302 domain-containing protein [Bryobacterales bacterium]
MNSGKSLEQIDAALRDSAARHKFGIITVHDLQATMKNKGVEFSKACMVYEVCNPHQAKKVLESNGAVSTALPCRISVYEVPGGYHIATLLPTALMKMFGNPELEPVAKEVEDVVTEMIRDAA